MADLWPSPKTPVLYVNSDYDLRQSYRVILRFRRDDVVQVANLLTLNPSKNRVLPIFSTVDGFYKRIIWEERAVDPIDLRIRVSSSPSTRFFEHLR